MSSCIGGRRHPEYAENEAAWKRARDAYAGGADYIKSALIRHVSEIELEFEERLRRAYYFNYPRAIAQRITQYALAVDPVRQNADPDLVENWSRKGLRTNEVMRQVSTMLNVYGRVWLLAESPEFSGAITVAEAKRRNLRPYITVLSPLEVIDWSFGDDGQLRWAITERERIVDDDPHAERRRVKRRTLYTREEWHIYDIGGDGVQEVAAGVNAIGRVPMVSIVEPDGYGMDARHWFEDVVRISEAILNNESEAQMNVVKQMFGMLVISDTFARGAQRVTDKDGNAKGFAATVARSAAVIESVEEKGVSRYISPSGVETTTIRQENANLKAELYNVVGLAVQSASREAQTAESKAWDFQNVTQFLANRADLLEQAELAAWELLHEYDPAVPVPELQYNRKFAVCDLAANIQGLLQLSSLPGGTQYQRGVMRAALDLLDKIGSLTPEQYNAISAEIDKLEPAPMPDIDFGAGGVDNKNDKQEA